MSGLYVHFQQVVTYWKQELENYDHAALHYKPDGDNGWSMGQLYTHIVEFSREYYVPAIEKCLESTENSDQFMSYEAYNMFSYGNFPPFKKHRSLEEMLEIKQPENAQEIEANLQAISEEMEALAARIEQTPSGKVEELGLGFLDATEYFLMNCMHWRHHMLDKWELEERLVQHVMVSDESAEQ